MNAITPRPATDAPDTQPAAYQAVAFARRQQEDSARPRQATERRHATQWAAPDADEVWRDDAKVQNDAEPCVDEDGLDNTLLLRLIAAVALAVVALAAASALLSN